MRYAHGLVLGKFYPPHAGHAALIRAAADCCDAVTVLVEASTVESIPLDERVAWLAGDQAALHNVTVVGARCDVPTDMTDEQVWVAQVAIMQAALEHHGRPRPDAVFTSESYGPELARRLGAEHVSVDPERRTVPISATAVRRDLAGQWDQLGPATRAGLTTRIVVVGAESTGTTTLTRALAEHYRERGGVWSRTAWVPEYGRQRSIELLEQLRAEARAAGRPEPVLDAVEWKPDDFAAIAERQTAMENEAAAAGSPLLLCDTDAFATTVWERRYLGPGSRVSAPWGTELLPRRDLYLLTSHDGVPFEQDGLRDGEAIRADMTGWFAEALTAAGHSWVLLTGNREERMRLAVRCVDLALERRVRFADPLS